MFTLNSAVNYIMLQSSQCYSYILNDECKKTSHFAECDVIFQKLLRKNTFSRSAEELLKVKRFHTELSYSKERFPNGHRNQCQIKEFIEM